ncbi:DBH-like monooxygenase protein 1 homolog [Lampetra fluviatilis]
MPRQDLPARMTTVVMVVVMMAVGVSCALDPDADLTFSTELSPDKFHVSWAFDSDQIVLEARVRTRGWVGLGLSSTGMMAGSDVVVGWVDSAAATHLVDGHIEGERSLVRDASQDYKLVRLSENGTHTVMRVVRALRTCDANDRDITEDTVRMIWAYSTDDPKSETQILYHGVVTRGSKSVQLLSNGFPTEQPLPQEHSFIDLTFDKYTIPTASTFYACKLVSLPKLSKKNHLIKVQPIVQAGNEAFVHHILVYVCLDNVNASHVGVTHQCYHPNMPDSFSTCSSVLAAWAIGGGTFDYPPEAGYSLGAQGDPKMVLIEMHYDNPGLVSRVNDSSGLRFYITPELRAYDAGVLETGLDVQIMHFVPPGAPSYTNYGICPTQGFATVGPDGAALPLQGAMSRPRRVAPGREATQSGEMKVFATMLHAHLLGRAVQVRHYRDGKQISDLGRDMGYDFNFQETRYLKELVSVMPGDSIITECLYNSKERSSTTTGGLSTQEEMCLGFLHYYPKVNVSRCLSIYDMTQVAPAFGYIVMPSYPHLIITPVEDKWKPIFFVYDKVNWTEQTIRTVEMAARMAEQYAVHADTNGFQSFPGQRIPEIPADPEAPPCNPTTPTTKPTMRPTTKPTMRPTTKPTTKSGDKGAAPSVHPHGTWLHLLLTLPIATLALLSAESLLA